MRTAFSYNHSCFSLKYLIVLESFMEQLLWLACWFFCSSCASLRWNIGRDVSGVQADPQFPVLAILLCCDHLSSWGWPPLSSSSSPSPPQLSSTFAKLTQKHSHFHHFQNQPNSEPKINFQNNEQAVLPRVWLLPALRNLAICLHGNNKTQRVPT